MRLPVASLLFLIALPLVAQEPRPAQLLPELFVNPDGVGLTLPWRYAPGDDPARARPDADDGRWPSIAPEFASLPPGWTGVGWFRRHVVIAPAMEGKPLALTLVAPGIADVYADGAPVLTVGRRSSFVPAERRDTTVVTFRGPRHVLAVRYVYPLRAAPSQTGFGFRLSLATPAPPAPPPFRDWIVATHGALVGLPLFLAFLHFALYAFDRRARENLFYAAEMLAFAVIIFHEYRSNFLSSDAAQNLVDRVSAGGPVVAIFFGMLTYYAVRTNRLPSSWRLFGALGAVLLVMTYVFRGSADFTWVIYFAVMLVEIVHVERTCEKVPRGGVVFFLASFTVFGASIVMQILINFNVIESIAGVREVYVFGIVASAAGMSLYLAYNLGQSRKIELENERKSEELARARRLQLSMLPQELPRVEGLDVAVATQTAAEVGGDYYDVRRAGGGALLFAFGDATGHGLASGILVTVAKALFTSLPPDGALGAHLVALDRTLRDMRVPGFLRMCLSLARISPREAAVACAAMPPLLIRRASGRIEELGSGDVPLGSRLAANYREWRTELAPGDTLLFASDGFAEQSRSDGKQFGYDSVTDAFRDAGIATDAHSVVNRLLAVAQQFRGAEPQRDDITLLVVRVTSASR